MSNYYKGKSIVHERGSIKQYEDKVAVYHIFRIKVIYLQTYICTKTYFIDM